MRSTQVVDVPKEPEAKPKEPEAKPKEPEAPGQKKVPGKRLIAVCNIRSAQGDFRPGDKVPNDVTGIRRLLAIGAVKAVE